MTDRYTLRRDSYGVPYAIERNKQPLFISERNGQNAPQLIADLNAYDAAWEALPIAIQKACEPDHAGDVAHGIALLIARTAEAARKADAETRPRWRKMDSAPKDGSYILVHFPDGDQMARLRWVAEREQWRDKSGNIWRVTKAARWIALPPVDDDPLSSRQEPLLRSGSAGEGRPSV